MAQVIAAAVALLVTPATGQAIESTGQSQSSGSQLASELSDAAEPFGRLGSEVVDGPLVEKWQGVKRIIEAEMTLLSLCRIDVALCPSPAAFEFLSIVERARQRDGLARAGEINRAINLDIRPASDLELYHVSDFWSSPLATLTARAGDCEDYAIAKLVALGEAGLAARDLRMVILRDRLAQEDHAVVAVRIENRWRILDNRRFVMLDDTQYIHFQPIFSIDETGIKRYLDFPLVSASVASTQPYL
jgi:predicted transglutaminase-like cysteine proteinase